jgi:hypothetical protein
MDLVGARVKVCVGIDGINGEMGHVHSSDVDHYFAAGCVVSFEDRTLGTACLQPANLKLVHKHALFEHMPDDLIVRVARQLPLEHAGLLPSTCQQLHSLASTRKDEWCDWRVMQSALEEEFPLPEQFDNDGPQLTEEQLEDMSLWRMQYDPRAAPATWASLTPRERVYKMISFGNTISIDLREAGLEVAERFFDNTSEWYSAHNQARWEVLEADPARYHLATRLSTLYFFEGELRSGQLPYDTEDLLAGDYSWPGGSWGRNALIWTFLPEGDSEQETDEPFGNDRQLAGWVQGLPPFSPFLAHSKIAVQRRKKDRLRFGAGILDGFQVVPRSFYMAKLAALWCVDVDEARARVDQLVPGGWGR